MPAPGACTGVPCCQARWQREAAAFAALALADPLIPLLGMDPEGVISGWPRMASQYQVPWGRSPQGRSSASAGRSLLWNRMQPCKLGA